MNKEGAQWNKEEGAQPKTCKRNCICSDLADFAYAGTYAELTPSLRETRRRKEKQKRGRQIIRKNRRRMRRRRRRTRRERRERTVPPPQPHNSTILPRSTHTHTSPPASMDLACADPYAELTRACARRCSARKNSKMHNTNPHRSTNRLQVVPHSLQCKTHCFSMRATIAGNRPRFWPGIKISCQMAQTHQPTELL